MKINNKNYTIPELDFNAMCALEEMGVTFGDMNKKAMATARAFLALAMDNDVVRAGEELYAHIKAGGDLAELSEEISKAVVNSGFFQKVKAEA